MSIYAHNEWGDRALIPANSVEGLMDLIIDLVAEEAPLGSVMDYARELVAEKDARIAELEGWYTRAMSDVRIAELERALEICTELHNELQSECEKLESQGAGEPVAWMWQHEETGRIGFIDPWQFEQGWQASNPRHKLIKPLYTRPPAPEQAEVVKDAQRYRNLRRGQKWSVIDGCGDTLRADALDAAIDAIAMEKQS